jgi:hypothetical protein
MEPGVEQLDHLTGIAADSGTVEAGHYIFLI